MAATLFGARVDDPAKEAVGAGPAPGAGAASRPEQPKRAGVDRPGPAATPVRRTGSGPAGRRRCGPPAEPPVQPAEPPVQPAARGGSPAARPTEPAGRTSLGATGPTPAPAAATARSRLEPAGRTGGRRRRRPRRAARAGHRAGSGPGPTGPAPTPPGAGPDRWRTAPSEPGGNGPARSTLEPSLPEVNLTLEELATSLRPARRAGPGAGAIRAADQP